MLKKMFRLTKDGASELEKELAELVAERQDIAQRIKTAREFGDLAENAEYQSARADQEKVDARISEVEHILQNLQIISAPKQGSKVVQLGSKVKLKDGGSKNKEFQVVGTVEADPLAGKISDESPIGKLLIGKKVGDEVELKTPSEISIFKITEIA